MADPLGARVRNLIRAFHGSPYDFDRFDASKIGTGEGAQAYGYGLYFAQNPAVAKESKNSVVASPSYSSPEEIAADYLFVHGTPQDAMRVMRDHSKWLIRHGKLPMYQQALKLLNDGASITPKEFPHIDAPGRMYEVEIGYPEEALLNYDRPFANPAGVVGAEVLRQHNPAAVSASALRAIQDGSWRMESFAGRSPYETAAVELTRLAKTRGGAQALMDAGVPGVRYLDQASRAAGDGTRNYVMFPGTEDSIRILRKFGLLAPVATGAAMEEE